MERSAPAQLPGNAVTLLQIYGNMFYAGAYRLEELLPAVGEARRAIVILRLRGHSSIGSTFIGVIERYARKLQANGGRLMLVGLDPAVKSQLDRTETNETIADGDVFLAGEQVSLSVEEALAAANRWLEQTAGNEAQ